MVIFLEVWIDWIEDVTDSAETKEEKWDVVSLFRRALRDYISVSIWVEFVSWMEEIYNDGWL